jgi:hypothetical protein
MNKANSTAMPFDDRAGQAVRVAEFMQLHSEGVTTSEIQQACDPGSVTKLLSEMRSRLGYVIRRELCREVCANGTKQRKRWRFILVSRPSEAQQNLFPPT